MLIIIHNEIMNIRRSNSIHPTITAMLMLNRNKHHHILLHCWSLNLYSIFYKQLSRLFHLLDLLKHFVNRTYDTSHLRTVWQLFSRCRIIGGLDRKCVSFLSLSLSIYLYTSSLSTNDSHICIFLPF